MSFEWSTHSDHSSKDSTQQHTVHTSFTTFAPKGQLCRLYNDKFLSVKWSWQQGHNQSNTTSVDVWGTIGELFRTKAFLFSQHSNHYLNKQKNWSHVDTVCHPDWQGQDGHWEHCIAIFSLSSGSIHTPCSTVCCATAWVLNWLNFDFSYHWPTHNTP